MNGNNGMNQNGQYQNPFTSNQNQGRPMNMIDIESPTNRLQNPNFSYQESTDEDNSGNARSGYQNRNISEKGKSNDKGLDRSFENNNASYSLDLPIGGMSKDMGKPSFEMKEMSKGSKSDKKGYVNWNPDKKSKKGKDNYNGRHSRMPKGNYPKGQDYNYNNKDGQRQQNQDNYGNDKGFDKNSYYQNQGDQDNSTANLSRRGSEFTQIRPNDQFRRGKPEEGYENSIYKTNSEVPNPPSHPPSSSETEDECPQEVKIPEEYSGARLLPSKKSSPTTSAVDLLAGKRDKSRSPNSPTMCSKGVSSAKKKKTSKTLPVQISVGSSSTKLHWADYQVDEFPIIGQQTVQEGGSSSSKSKNQSQSSNYAKNGKGQQNQYGGYSGQNTPRGPHNAMRLNIRSDLRQRLQKLPPKSDEYVDIDRVVHDWDSRK